MGELKSDRTRAKNDDGLGNIRKIKDIVACQVFGAREAGNVRNADDGPRSDEK